MHGSTAPALWDMMNCFKISLCWLGVLRETPGKREIGNKVRQVFGGAKDEGWME